MTKISFPILLVFVALVRSEEVSKEDMYKYYVNGIVDDENVSWEKFMVKARWTTNYFVEYIKPYFNDSFTSGNVSESCVNSFQLYFEGLKKWEPWAIKMADATSRIPSGILVGTMMDYGSFDECLEVRANTNDTSESFRGQYCMVGFRSSLIQPMHLKTPTGKTYIEAYGKPSDWAAEYMQKSVIVKHASLVLGTCLPSTCSEKDVYNLFSIALKPWAYKVFISSCEDDEPKPWPTSMVAAFFILSTLFGICLLGTILDIKDRNQHDDTNGNTTLNNSGFKKVLKYFSCYTNSIKVFEKRKRSSDLDCLEGIRVFLSLWVIFSHIIGYPEHLKEMKFSSTRNLLNLFGIFTIFTENAYLNMENFSMVSGFLLVYTKKRVLDKNGGKMDLVEFVINKYFRLMPVFIFAIITMGIMPVMNSGPIWNSTWNFELAKCQKYWWWNIILIQNFLHINDMCMLHSWFVGNLMQVQLAGAILMLITYRWRKTGIIVGAMLVASCISLDFITALSNEFYLPAFHQITDVDMIKDFVSYIYCRPTHHFSSFVCGMVLAWILLTYKDLKFSKAFRTICWVTTFAFFVITMYGTWIPTKDFRIISAYLSLRTLAWGLGSSWVAFSLLTGQLNVVKRIFASEALVPLSRISYCIYVFHPLVLIYWNAIQRGTIYIAHVHQVFEATPIVVFSIGLAFIGHITVEQPFTSIYIHLHEKLYSGQGSKTIASKYAAQINNGKPKSN